MLEEPVKVVNILDEYVDFVNDTYYKVTVFIGNDENIYIRTEELKTKHSNGRTEQAIT